MKLFKYNWRVSSTGFYITMVAVALLYMLLLVGKSQWGWHEVAIFVSGTVVSAFSVLILIGIVSMNYNHSMKSYHRRLLPLSPLTEIGSMLLLSIIYALSTIMLSLVFISIVSKYLNYDEFQLIMSELLTVKSVITLLLFVIWSTIMLMTLLMLSITASYCFKGRYRAWIGVAVFILTATITDYISSKIVGPSYEQYFSFIEFNFEATERMDGGLGFSYPSLQFWSLPFIIEVIVVGGQVLATYYLIKRRIQL